MPRPEKVQAVADITERLEGAQAVFLAEYAGLSVKAQQNLRRQLKAKDAEFKVVKMTLARRAAADLELAELDELLTGPTGLTYADGDPVGAAKVLRDFAKENEVFSLKGGLLGRDFLTPERIAELADIEPREVLLAKIAGAMKAPMANAAGLFAALPRNAASVFQQLLEKKEREPQAGAPAEAPTEEPAADAEETEQAPAAPAPVADAETTEARDEAVIAEASEDAGESEDSDAAVKADEEE